MSSRHDIDYENFIFDGCLKKVINSSSFEQNKTPELEKAWVVEFEPKRSSLFLKFIKNEVSQDPVQFQYLKRIKKVVGESTRLVGIACSVKFVSELDQLEKLIGKYLTDVEISTIEVPNNYPYNKEISDEWGQKYWPMIWKGNPVIQDLNQITLDITLEKKYLSEISQISRDLTTRKEFPVVTMFRDPVSDKTIIVQKDERSSKTPITHGIIDCIQQIAALELCNRQQDITKNYLCLNYHVYTTHEPCSMCVMALIHSRIGKLTYIRSSSATGSVEEQSGLGHGVETFSGLNWKFESWKWCGEDYGVAELDESIFV